jgi:aspartyl-tRNA(Asn)/glutamyl-tRNA(Gln) amidotransferase subunit C
MKITLQEVEHVARLARLALPKEEMEQMRSQLDRILGYIEKLNQLDTTGVEALANAPDRREGFFQVPRIIEQ